MSNVVRRAALAVLVTASSSFAGPVPAALVGGWVAANVSATTYWADTGRFLGNGRGTGQFYAFNADGTFKYYAVIELRSGYVTSRVNTTYEGRVSFDDGTFTVTPVKGHYFGTIGTTVTDRPMTDAELARSAKAYAYRLGTGDDGKPAFVIPFEDGSRFVFTRSELPKS